MCEDLLNTQKTLNLSYTIQLRMANYIKYKALYSLMYRYDNMFVIRMKKTDNP